MNEVLWDAPKYSRNWALITNFSFEVGRLKERRLLHQNNSLEISGTRDKFRVKTLDEEDFRSLMLQVRKFTIGSRRHKDPLIPDVLKALRVVFPGDAEEIRVSEEYYNKLLYGKLSPMPLNFNGKDITGKELLDAYFYGEIVHRENKEKVRNHLELYRSEYGPIAIMCLQMFVLDLTTYVIQLGNCIRTRQYGLSYV